MMYTGKDFLFACSYMPEEIVGAAGLRPVRLFTRARPSDADTAIHPTTCPYIKAVYSAAARGDYSGAGGMTIVNSCDGMRRLFDALSALGAGPPVIFLDVPQKRDSDAVDLFAAQLRRFSQQVERESGGSRVTTDGLERAITEKNAVRRQMMQLFLLQKGDGSAPSGRAVFSFLVDAAAGKIQDIAGRIDALTTAARGAAGNAKRRIVLSANIVDRPELIEMIEDFGACVVAMDTCIGERSYEGLVAERTADPIRAVAERYLTRPPCPRMEGITDRIDYLVDLARTSRADGVITSTVKYCDSWLYDLPFLKERLEAKRIPVLPLENDYEWSGLGQMRTRVEAFLETLG